MVPDRWHSSRVEDPLVFFLATLGIFLQDSTESGSNFSANGNGTPEAAFTKMENVREVPHRHFPGTFDSVSGSISEVRKFITALDSLRLGIQGHRWSKVKQAIVSGCNDGLSGPRSTDPPHPDDQVPCSDADANKFQHTKPYRTIFKQLTRVDTKAHMRNGNSDGEAEVRTHNPSLIEDPLLIKISKKNRNIGKFTIKPESIPEAVCFEIRGTELRHQDVKMQLEKALQTCPEVQIMTIRFHHRALVHGQRDMNNRWIITTNSVAGRTRLAGTSLEFNGQAVKLLAYDDVVNAEYQQFVRMRNFVSMMDSRNILT